MTRYMLLIAGLTVLMMATSSFAGITISSPLAPPPASHNLTLTVPVIPAPGLILGWAGGSGAGVTGSVAFNFGPKSWQPLSFDLLSMNNLKTEGLGVFFPASKVAQVIGVNPPAGTIWATLLGAVGGGPYVGYDTNGKKVVWGAYYRASLLELSW
jgi:hypothetical protein